MNFAVLASTNGSDLPAIFNAFSSGEIQGKIVCGVVNDETCNAKKKLEVEGVPTFFLNHKGKDRELFDAEISQVLKEKNVDYIICVGYMLLFSSAFIQQWQRRIINIHPSLLPAFPGIHSIQDALDYGCKVTGATVHFIDEGVDTGPILEQAVVRIDESETLETLKAKVQQAEQEIYPAVLAKISRGEIA